MSLICPTKSRVERMYWRSNAVFPSEQSRQGLQVHLLHTAHAMKPTADAGTDSILHTAILPSIIRLNPTSHHSKLLD